MATKIIPLSQVTVVIGKRDRRRFSSLRAAFNWCEYDYLEDLIATAILDELVGPQFCRVNGKAKNA